MSTELKCQQKCSHTWKTFNAFWTLVFFLLSSRRFILSSKWGKFFGGCLTEPFCCCGNRSSGGAIRMYLPPPPPLHLISSPILCLHPLSSCFCFYPSLDDLLSLFSFLKSSCSLLPSASLLFPSYLVIDCARLIPFHKYADVKYCCIFLIYSTHKMLISVDSKKPYITVFPFFILIFVQNLQYNYNEKAWLPPRTPDFVVLVKLNVTDLLLNQPPGFCGWVKNDRAAVYNHLKWTTSSTEANITYS